MIVDTAKLIYSKDVTQQDSIKLELLDIYNIKLSELNINVFCIKQPVDSEYLNDIGTMTKILITNPLQYVLNCYAKQQATNFFDYFKDLNSGMTSLYVESTGYITEANESIEDFLYCFKPYKFITLVDFYYPEGKPKKEEQNAKN